MTVGDLVRLNPDYPTWSSRWIAAGILKPTYRVGDIAGMTVTLVPVIEGTVVGPHGQTSVRTSVEHYDEKVIPV